LSGEPILMLLWCPACGERHVDRNAFATKLHHTHACQACGMTWRPAIEMTVGVQHLPGFKDEHQVGDSEERRARRRFPSSLPGEGASNG
jgi:hypothetical protein